MRLRIIAQRVRIIAIRVRIIALTVRIRAPTCGLRQVANEREFRSEAVFIEMRLQARRAVQQFLAPIISNPKYDYPYLNFSDNAYARRDHQCPYSDRTYPYSDYQASLFRLAVPPSQPAAHAARCEMPLCCSAQEALTATRTLGVPNMFTTLAAMQLFRKLAACPSHLGARNGDGQGDCVQYDVQRATVPHARIYATWNREE